MAKALTAVALGLFDGVHLGHRAVLDAVCAQRANGLTPSVFTFEPESVLRKSSGSTGFISCAAAALRISAFRTLMTCAD